MSLKWNFKASLESLISCKNKKIEKIMQIQQKAKLNLAKKTKSKYKSKTVSILNKKPKAENPITNFR